MTVKEILQFSKNELNDFDSAMLDAEVLLSFVLEKDKAWIYARLDKEIKNKDLKKFKKLIDKRKKGVPAAYLIGYKEFFGLNFEVNKNVLIPRPETEMLVEKTIDLVGNKKNIKLLEIGTGSGCIIISLAKNLEVKFVASDVSKKALKIAKKNAIKNNVLGKIKFVKSDLLKNIKEEKFDIIVANLPYLDINHKNLLESSETRGLKFEPQQALYSGEDGLDLYRELFLQIAELDNKPKFIVCELGDKQADKFERIVKKSFENCKINFVKDAKGLRHVGIIEL